MPKSIEEIFKPQSASVLDTFAAGRGSVGFRIPIYQRNYDWKSENIERLFEDCVAGLAAFGSEEDALTFLGSIILVDEADGQENTFEGKSWSVVDGQQRLTTLALISAILIGRLSQIDISVMDDSEAKDWLEDEQKKLCENLCDCIGGRPSSSSRDLNDYSIFPRVVREDLDTRGREAREAEYRSDIARFLHQRALSWFFDRPITDFSPYRPGSDAEAFRKNLREVTKWVDKIANAEDEMGAFVPDVNTLLAGNYLKLFFKFRTRGQEANYQGDVMRAASIHLEIKNLVRLLAFGNYFVNQVAITRVEAADERYALDIFDALNSTGEPLTAIETFKPRVIRFEQSTAEGFESSASDEYFREIAGYLDRFRSDGRRQAATKEILVSFAYYMTGYKLGFTPALQRKYLRDKYEEISGAAEAESKRRFVKSIRDILDYRDRFWELKNLVTQLPGETDREEVLFYLAVLKDAKNPLSIPVLCRYYVDACNRDDFQDYKQAVKAVAAFMLLRRSATVTTKGIDSDYQNLMSRGRRTGNNSKPLKLGLEEESILPSIDELKEYLKSYLANRPMEIVDKQSWKRHFLNAPIYDRPELARAMLLIASNNAKPSRDDVSLLNKVRESRELRYISLDSWMSSAYESIEHIAPQSNRSNNWLDELYGDPAFVHRIGNLTLLPQGENNVLADHGWNRKRLLFKAFSADSEDELEEIFNEAREEGADLGPKIQDFLRSTNRSLPLAKTLANTDTWDRAQAVQRADNLADMIWHELAPNLGLPH